MFLGLNKVEILLLIYCLLFLFLLFYLGLKLQRKGWTLEILFLMLVLVNYVFIPINIIVFGDKIYDSTIESYMVPASKFVSFSSFFITLLFIITFLLGVGFRGSLSKPIRIYIRRVNGVNLYKLSSYFICLFSLFSLLIYIQQWGGFSSFLINLNLDRAGLLDEDVVGKYTVFGRFIDLAIIPIVYFFYEKHKTIINFICLLFLPLAILLVSILFLSTAKLKFFILVLLFYFALSIQKNKLYLESLFLISLGIFVGVSILDDMFIFIYKVFKDEGILVIPVRIASALIDGSLGQGQYEESLKSNSGNPYSQFLEYFTYIQMSLQLSLKNNYPILFFKDFFTGIIQLLPSRLNIPVGLEILKLNTALFYDYYPAIPEFNVTVPPGIIAFGMYSFSVPGVMIIAFILGYLFRAVDLFFQSVVDIQRNFSSFYAYIIVVLGFYSITGIPKASMYDLVFLVFLFIFFVVSFRIKSINQIESP